MRIVTLATDAFLPGAVPSRVRQEVRALCAAGHRVVVVTTPGDDGLARELTRETGCRILFIPLRAIPGPLFNVTKDLHFSLRAIWRVGRRLRDADVILNHSSTLAPAAEILRQRLRAPTGFIIHALIWDKLGSSPYGPVLTKAYEAANAYAVSRSTWLIPNSRYMGELAIAHGGDATRCRVVYNPVDLPAYVAPRSYKKEYDLVYLGRFSVEKGIEDLRDALLQIDRPLRVALIGDGPLRDAIVPSLQKHQVYAPGFLPPEAFKPILWKSRFAVMPSRAEAQGIAAVEALASGIQVLASDVGGLPEVVAPDWLVPPAAPALLAKAIEKRLARSWPVPTVPTVFSMAAFARDINSLCRQMSQTPY